MQIPKSVQVVYFHVTLFPPFLPAPFVRIGLGQHAPQLALNQAPPGESSFADSSGHIFSMYSEMATEEDKKMVEDWKADADGILIFVRLSSNLTIRAADSVINGHRLVYSPLLSHR